MRAPGAESCNTQMPTFFVVGAAKCGTTSLHSYLDLHPEISMSTVKEPMFFVPEAIREDWSFSWIAKTKSEYLALFEANTPVRGESSTAYTKYPMFPGVPEAIHAEVPDARMVLVVRDPIERASSAWVQLQQTRNSSNRRGNRLASFAELIGSLDSPENYLVWPGMYMTQIRQYLNFFPKESIMIVDSHELRLNRDSVMRDLFTFIGVNCEFRSPDFAREINALETKTVERNLYVRLTNSKTLRTLVDKLPESVRAKAIESVRKPLLKSAEKPVIDSDLRKRLEVHFRPEVEDLREFTGKAFSSWSI